MIRPQDFGKRRHFLKSVGVAGATLSVGEFGFLHGLPAVSAGESKLPPNAVEFSSEIEPLVRLLEDTPREKVVDVFATKIQSGTSYRAVLTALLLAGVRNIQPRPSVGFKFHAVLVVNSAHLASINSPDSDRWLPIFWALDYFKSAQATDVREGDWTMSAVDESKLPPAHRAYQAFTDAMDSWDVDAADTAIVALCRTAPANKIFNLLAHYGCRDYRSIGHKAIYVANAYRTLQCIGWRYSEPVLRSLAYALLNHEGQPNPATADLAPDAAWRVTQKKIATLGRNWNHGRLDDGATLSLLDTLRSASPSDAVNAAAEMIAGGIAPQSINDALFLSAAEMLGQQPGIISLHSATATNAVQYAFRSTGNDKTRRELLLQNAAFIPYFRESMRSRGEVRSKQIDIAIASDSTGETPSVDDIFVSVSSDRSRAAGQMKKYLEKGGRPESLIHAARRLVFLKGNDAHDYKFSSAALEDFYAVSPRFRNAYLASSAYLLPGSNDRDNGLVERVQSALA